MVAFVDKILVPYINKVRADLGKPDQKALVILDVFRAHRVDILRQKMTDSGIALVYVPAACTDQLQPLDLSVNKEFKDEQKHCFHRWYADEVVSQMDAMENESGEEADPSRVSVDLKLSRVKPLHGNWLITAFQSVQNKPSIIIDGFRKAGLL